MTICPLLKRVQVYRARTYTARLAAAKEMTVKAVMLAVQECWHKQYGKHSICQLEEKQITLELLHDLSLLWGQKSSHCDCAVGLGLKTWPATCLHCCCSIAQNQIKFWLLAATWVTTQMARNVQSYILFIYLCTRCIMKLNHYLHLFMKLKP